MINKTTVFFLSENLDSHEKLINLLMSRKFSIKCFHTASVMQPHIIPNEVPDIFLFDYSENGYTEEISKAVSAIREIDGGAIIFGLYSIFDKTEGHKALADGCTDIVNCSSVDFIVKKSSLLNRSKTAITKRIKRMTSVL